MITYPRCSFRSSRVIRSGHLLLALWLACAVGLTACSSTNPADAQHGERPGAAGPPGEAFPATPAWYTWVNKTLRIKMPNQGGQAFGSPAWNREVQKKLGSQAPAYPLGSKPWLHAIDTVVRLVPAPKSATQHK